MATYIVTIDGRVIGVSFVALSNDALEQAQTVGNQIITSALDISDLTVVAYNQDTKVIEPKVQSPIEELMAAAVEQKMRIASLTNLFTQRLTEDEQQWLRESGVPRTPERYTDSWLAWAMNQNDMAILIEAHSQATDEQKQMAAKVKLGYLAVKAWLAQVTNGAMMAAYVALQTAVESGDVKAVKAAVPDFSPFVINSGFPTADPDIMEADLRLSLDAIQLVVQ